MNRRLIISLVLLIILLLSACGEAAVEPQAATEDTPEVGAAFTVTTDEDSAFPTDTDADEEMDTDEETPEATTRTTPTRTAATASPIAGEAGTSVPGGTGGEVITDTTEGITGTTTLTGTATVTGTASIAGTPAAEPSLIDTLVESGQYITLTAALDVAGLTGILQEDTPYTLFAPTDDAFASLPQETMDALLNDPQLLEQVLLYHVVEGGFPSSELATFGSVDTIEGNIITISTEGGNIVLNDGVTIIEPDLQASNGVVHGIDRVLLPVPGLDVPGIVPSDDDTPESPALPESEATPSP